MSACIAVINAGSSSIKFAVYKSGAEAEVAFRGQVAGIGTDPRLTVRNAGGDAVGERKWPGDGFDHGAAIRAILEDAVDRLGGVPVAAVGHRVVHGGTLFCEPVRIDDRVTTELRALCPLAPLHQPHNLAAIAAIAEGAPHIPQVACFDTAFHRNQPELAQMFALPRELRDWGLRRYGFHGLSYEYVSQRLVELWPALAGGRVIVAHLGNGASLCALRSGRSVATTMGFTPADGLVMGTRCGSIDPGVLLYLMEERGLDARAIEDLIYKKSGLLGVSGISSDMRTLQASDEVAARLAIDLFVYRAVREIGSLVAALCGLDALVFTGGIGENDPAVREAIVDGSRWLGIDIDDERNRLGKGLISSERSLLPVWIVATDEERMIARHTADVLGLD
ncbi:MAG: acetate/propionate family kinase [Allosphingosinicella sp.]